MVHRGHLWMRISGIENTSTGPEDHTAPYLTPAFTNGYEALTCLAKLYSLQAFPRDLSAARQQQPTFACHRTHSMR
jgi:hypothetical protein